MLKNTNRHPQFRAKPLCAVLLLGFAVQATTARHVQANPAGASVASGQASFAASGNTLTVTNTPGAIINWQSFSIGANEATRFAQQSASSAVLNRVTGANPSSILGSLQSNGRVFLVNPHGIVFGKGATIDTAGFIASTLDISDRDFLEGRLRFGGGGNGALKNEGAIRASGDIYLIGPQIENTGLIRSESGSVLLAAGKSVTISSPDAQGVQFALQAPEDAALNLGTIEAKNAAAMFAGTLRHSGDIRATRVVLSAKGNAILEGDARVLADNAVGRGGRIEILGERVALLDRSAVSASGADGGGEILVGGDYRGTNPLVRNATHTHFGQNATLYASATARGDGGKVIVWANDTTRAYGAIAARGGPQGGNAGLVETSGKHYLEATRAPDLSAPAGRGGTWLLDPETITISTAGNSNISGASPFRPAGAGGSMLNNGTLNAALDGGGTIIVDTTGGGAGAGDINMNAAVAKGAGPDSTLHLKAHNNININAAVSSSSNKLNLTLEADQDGIGGGVSNINAGINTNGGVIDATAGSGVINIANVSVAGVLKGGAFNVAGGFTPGPATLAQGTLNWDGGTIGGTLTVDSGATVNANNAVAHVMSGATVNNSGVFKYNGATNLQINGNSVFNNLAGGVFEFTTDGSIFEAGGCFPCRINNSGTFLKSGGTGNSDIGGNVLVYTGTSETLQNASAGSLRFTSTHASHAHNGTVTLTGGNIQFVSGTHSFGAGGTVNGTLNIAGATASFGGTTLSNTTDYSSGSFSGTATLPAGSVLNWDGATTISGGTLTVDSGATVNANNAVAHVMSGATVNNSGVFKYNGATNLQINGNSVFNNLAGGVFEFTTDGSIFEAGGCFPCRINNSGTFLKSGGTGNSDIGGNVLVYTGTSETLQNASAGNLRFTSTNSGHAHNGTVTLTGGNIQFVSGTHSFGAGGTINGTLNIAGATASFGGTTLSNTTDYSSGSFSGTATLPAGSILNWGGGSINGGTLNVSSGGTVNMNSAGWNLFQSTTINNSGLMRMYGGGSGGLLLANNSVFNNQAGGVLEFTTDGYIAEPYGCFPCYFNNSGTILKSGGAGTAWLGGNVLTYSLNAGSRIQSDSGTIELAKSITNSGAITVGAGAIFKVSNGLTLTNAASGVIEGSGTYDLSASGLVNNGIIRPGGAGATGNLTFSGSFTHALTGQLDIELNGAPASGNYDQLTVTGNMNPSGGNLGAMNIAFLGGYSAMVGDTFTILNRGGGGGTFGTVNAPTGATTNVSYLVGGNMVTLALGNLMNNWNTNSDGLWGTWSNWTLGIPNSTQDVIINRPAANVTVTLDSGSQSAKSVTLSGSDNLTVSGGSLDIATLSTVNTGSALAIEGGTLQGAGNLDINGTLRWSGGTLAGTGTINFLGGSVFDTTGSGARILNGPLLGIAALSVPAGSLAVQSGGITVSGATTFGTGTTFTLADGTTTFNGATTLDTFDMRGGTLAGSGAVTVNNSFIWSGGTQSGTGSTTVANTATFTVTGAANKWLDTRALTSNSPSGMWGGTGSITLTDAAAFNNAGLLVMQSDAVMNRSLTGMSFNNSGTLRKNGGTGTSQIGDNAITFTNSGTVDVVTGTLDFGAAGTQTGAFNVAAGAALNFAGPMNLGDGATLSGAGTFNLSSGVGITGTGAGATIAAGTTVPLAGVTLGGTGLLHNLGTLALSGSTITGSLDNQGALNVDAGTFSVNGTLIQSGNINVASGATFQKTGGFINADTIAGAGTINVGAGGTLTNNGTISPGGAGTVGTLSITGNLNLTGGVLNIDLGGTGAGQSDRLAVTGNATTAGALNASLLAGYTPVNADAVPFMTLGGTAGGTFATSNLPAGFSAGYNLAAGEAARLVHAAGPSIRTFNNSQNNLDWGAAANWTGGLPGAADTALISGTFAVSHAYGTDTVAALTVDALNSLDVSGGSLAVSGATSIGGALSVSGTGTLTLNGASTVANLNMSGGTLAGSGAVTLNTASTWSSGTITGSGTLAVAAGGALDISGAGEKTLDARTLTNSGAINWNGTGTLFMQNDAVIVNQAGALINVTANGNVDSTSGMSTRIDNFGTFRKSAGTGQFSVYGSGAYLGFVNSGTVEAQSGILGIGSKSISTWTHTGTFSASTGARLWFIDGHLFGDGTLFTGGGEISIFYPLSGYTAFGGTTGATITSGTTFSFSGIHVGGGKLTNRGTLNLTDTLISGDLFNRGTLNVRDSRSDTSSVRGTLDLISGTLNLNAGSKLTKTGGAFNWLGGAISGTGNLVMGSGAAFNVTGAGARVLNGPTLGLGGLTLTGSLDVQGGALNLTGPSTISAGATLTASGGSIGSTSTLNVDGTLRAGAGSITATGITVTPTGLLTGSGSVTGNVTNNGTVAPGLSPGTLAITGDYIQGASGTLNIELAGTAAGQYDVLAVSGTATLGGAVNFTGAATSGRFPFLTASSGSGAFASQAGTLNPTLTYNAGDVTAAFAGLGIFWDGGASDGLWLTPANWSGDTLPTSTDDVTIGASAGTVTLASGAHSVNSLQCDANFALSGGASLTTFSGLTLGAGAALTSYGHLNLNTYSLGSGAKIHIGQSGPGILTIGGQPYTVINSLGQPGSRTGTDLQGMRADMSGRYALGSDIDASPTAQWHNGAGFEPVGASHNRYGNVFMGTFDGLGHTISGLTINRPTWVGVGLIGHTLYAHVRNVGIVGASVTGGAFVGGLVGANDTSAIINSYATGNVTGHGADVRWSATGQQVRRQWDTGGLVGQNYFDGTISNSYSTAAVNAPFDVGGLAGSNYGRITDSYATGSVRADVDINQGWQPGAGGLVGTNYSIFGEITNSYAAGPVAATGVSDYAGVGGLAGIGSATRTVNSYWNTQTSSQTTSAGGTGLTSAQMTSQANFAGWDFTNVWAIDQGSSYPYLRANTQIPRPAPLQLFSITMQATAMAMPANAAVVAHSQMLATLDMLAGAWKPAMRSSVDFMEAAVSAADFKLNLDIEELSEQRPATSGGSSADNKARMMGVDGMSKTGVDASREGKHVGSGTGEAIQNAVGEQGPITGAKYGDTFGGRRVNSEHEGGVGSFSGGGKGHSSQDSDNAQGSSIGLPLLGAPQKQEVPRSNGDTAGVFSGTASTVVGGRLGEVVPTPSTVTESGRGVLPKDKAKQPTDETTVSAGGPVTRQEVQTNMRGVSGRTGGAGSGNDGRTEQQGSGSGGGVVIVNKAEGAVREEGTGTLNMDAVLKINTQVNPGGADVVK